MENTTNTPNGVSKNSLTKEEYEKYMRTTAPCKVEAVSPRVMAEIKQQTGCQITATDFVAIQVQEPARANSGASLQPPADPLKATHAAEINGDGVTIVLDGEKGRQERVAEVKEDDSRRMAREQIELEQAAAEKYEANNQMQNPDEGTR